MNSLRTWIVAPHPWIWALWAGWWFGHVLRPYLDRWRAVRAARRAKRNVDIRSTYSFKALERKLARATASWEAAKRRKDGLQPRVRYHGPRMWGATRGRRWYVEIFPTWEQAVAWAITPPPPRPPDYPAPSLARTLNSIPTRPGARNPFVKGSR